MVDGVPPVTSSSSTPPPEGGDDKALDQIRADVDRLFGFLAEGQDPDQQDFNDFIYGVMQCERDIKNLSPSDQQRFASAIEKIRKLYHQVVGTFHEDENEYNRMPWWEKLLWGVGQGGSNYVNEEMFDYIQKNQSDFFNEMNEIKNELK